MSYERLSSFLKSGDSPGDCGKLKIYPHSLNTLGNDRVIMFADERGRHLMSVGNGVLNGDLEGPEYNGYKICGLTHENRLVLNKYFPFTNPSPLGYGSASIGLGDRLGTATDGHLTATGDTGVLPVLAQQSMRELNLTGRNFHSVLDDVCFSVFRMGYRGKFGADGDHLKNETDIKHALDCGYTMVTLDCSDMLDTSVPSLSDSEKTERIKGCADKRVDILFKDYADRKFNAGSAILRYTEKDIAAFILMYHKALDLIETVYNDLIRPHHSRVDFEISIDETSEPTSPASHYIISRELSRKKIPFTSIAPRFPGEFQKAVDYRGNLRNFEKEYKIHQAIADEFGYKLSIHSGSDKFRIYPIIGEVSGKKFHLKTSGTHWLEAVRLISRKDPELYRKIHAHALKNHHQAAHLYHITADISAVKPLQEVSDGDLEHYCNDENARQMLHIAYGNILSGFDAECEITYKERIYTTISHYKDEYDRMIADHTSKHLAALGV